MRIFKTKTLARFTRQQGISDESLVEAVHRAMRGLIDADLGGQVIKQQVARPGQGKRGGFRMLIGFGPRSGRLSVRLCKKRAGKHQRRRIAHVS